MRVLMLGWEYPPHISGGLGTACEGLTKALSRLGVQIDFVVPHLYGNENAPHMKLLDPSQAFQPSENQGQSLVAQAVRSMAIDPAGIQTDPAVLEMRKRLMEAGVLGSPDSAVSSHDPNINFIRVPSYLTPYLSMSPTSGRKKISRLLIEEGAAIEDEELFAQLLAMEDLLPPVIRSLIPESLKSGDQDAGHYSRDLFSEVGRYTARVLALIKNKNYDAIHAHDWMTYPAGVALKVLTGLPLVVHVHSLEYDRAGANGNGQIEQIEKAGLEAADSVVAVSYYTRSLVHQRHQVPLEKIGVVHNGVYAREVVANYRKESTWPSKIVLFLGRVTYQKGPEYFVEAASRVIPKIPDALFVMAGSGDMLPRMIDRVNDLGISNNFLFTGFLKGQEVERMLSMADLYVMPSVSEPFGISALEAISYNTPVIISRQSGVSEVLNHALKVDFWDVDQLANLILSVLKYPELGQDISLMAGEEVRQLRWDAAAAKTLEIYGKTLAHAPLN